MAILEQSRHVSSGQTDSWTSSGGESAIVDVKPACRLSWSGGERAIVDVKPACRLSWMHVQTETGLDAMVRLSWSGVDVKPACRLSWKHVQTETCLDAMVVVMSEGT